MWLLKFHFSEWHFPFLALLGNQLYLPSWSVASPRDHCVFFLFLLIHISVSRCPVVKQGSVLEQSALVQRKWWGADTNGSAHISKEISARNDLGVCVRWKPRQPLVAPGKLFLLTASLSITARFLYLPKLPSLANVYRPDYGHDFVFGDPGRHQPFTCQPR